MNTEFSLADFESLPEGEAPAEDWLISEGMPPDDEFLKPPYRCPDPTRWKITTTVRAQGGWQLVSSAVYAKVAPVTFTFHSSRSITWGATYSETVKGSLKLIEMQLGITLDTHVTLTRSETLTYTVPKGAVMALYAAPAYVARDVSRTVYGSAMCNPVAQRVHVNSPVTHMLKVDRVH